MKLVGVNKWVFTEQRIGFIMVHDITDFTRRAPLIYSTELDQSAVHKENPINFWFHQKKDFAFYFTKNEFRIIEIANFEQEVLFASSEDIEEDGGRVFANSIGSEKSAIFIDGKFVFMRLNIDIESKSLTHFKPNALKIIEEIDYNRKPAIALSKDEKTLFLVRTLEGNKQLIPFERVSDTSFSRLALRSPPGSSSDLWNMTDQWSVFVDKEAAVIVSKGDMKNPGLGSISFLKNLNSSIFTQPQTKNIQLKSLALIEDKKLIVFINHGAQNYFMNILTFQDKIPSYPLLNFKISTESCLDFGLEPSLMKISNKDNNVVFWASRYLLIYNIKNLTMPLLKSSFALNIEKTIGLTLSKNERILYIFGRTTPYTEINQKMKLLIFDIWNVEVPKLLSSIWIDQQQISESTCTVELSHDDKILNIGFTGGLIMIDVHNPTKPVLFGYNYFLNEVHGLKLANNGSMLYAATFSGVTSFDITSQYILYMTNSDFKIGGSYPITLNVLKMNRNLRFDFMIKEHKFFKATLFQSNSSSKTSSNTALPTWITFDRERSLFIVEPKSSSRHGSYKIMVILSTQPRASAFVGLQSIPSEREAENLIINIQQSGYIDTQGYVSENFDLSKVLRLDPKYENIEKDIRVILSQNYIQALGEFSVSPSLEILEGRHLTISTLSKNQISITIQLDQARFVNKPFSFSRVSINGDKSSMHFEGFLDDINKILEEIVVDTGKLESSSGTITIIDGVNPLTSKYKEDLSKYFHVNQAPQFDNSLQRQIDNQPFYTGLYSTIEINQNTFTNNYDLPLEYSLAMQTPGEEVPSWISFRSLTLSLMGTPPEKYSPLSYGLKLIVKNEFKTITVPFTLRVNISFSYGIKLVSTYVGYLVSFIGFVYSLNKVYNILARKYYRYPRSFKLKMGQEITDNQIFPISFIKEEMKEAKTILRSLEKSSGGLLDYFVNPETGILDKEKVGTALQNLDNKYYNSADEFSRGIIKQLVINRIVEKQLASQQEAITRDTLKKIKSQWMDLVTVVSSSPPQFIVNSENLKSELLKFTSYQNGDEEIDISTSALLRKSQCNVDLLNNAICAHAFRHQNLSIETIRIDVVSHKKLKGNSLFLKLRRLFQKDIKPFVFLNKREIGYGVEYVVDKNTLHFIGQLTYDLKDDVIVVHIKNSRGRILREMSLTGMAGENQEVCDRKESVIEDISVEL